MDKLRARVAVGLAMRENMLGWIWECFLFKNEYLMQSPSWVWLQRPLTRQPVENEPTAQASFVDAINHWANLIGGEAESPVLWLNNRVINHNELDCIAPPTPLVGSVFTLWRSIGRFGQTTIETFSVLRLLDFFKKSLIFLE